MRSYHDISELIGHTPLLALERISAEYGLSTPILAKLERSNPAGSAKDRVALHMLDDAEARGLIGPGAVIIEPTSGNTGVGLAAVGAARGYRVILTMPETMSLERRMLLKAYGAEVVLTEGKLGMAGAVAKAEELAASTPNSFLAGQFDNPANPAAHEKTTGPEIWEDTDSRVGVFVAGIGTGGTITGVGRYLKAQDASVRVVGVEPASSPLLTEGRAGAHKLQGIGANFVPGNYDASVVDEVLPVPDDAAMELGRKLAAKEGVLCGITSGAAVWAAIQLAKRPEYAGKMIVALLPDTGERYLSTEMFA